MKVVTYLGSLVQLCCGEGGTLQTNITGMCRESSQCLGQTGFAPAHGVCAFPVYTAQAPGCSAGELSKAGSGLHAPPRSKPLRFRFSGTPQRHRLGWACVLCTSRSKQLRWPGAWWVHSPQVVVVVVVVVWVASYLLLCPSCSFSWVCSRSTMSGVPYVSSGELISDCDPPGRCQLSRIPGRLG